MAREFVPTMPALLEEYFEEVWLEVEAKREHQIQFAFIVSSMGTVLRINKFDSHLWRNLGVEVFDTYIEAASRFTAGDEARAALMYFEEV